MPMTKQQESRMLWALLAVLGVLVLYRALGGEQQRTAPLTFTPGMTVSSPVRRGIATSGPGTGADPVSLFLTQRVRPYPGVSRNIFQLIEDARVERKKPAAKPEVIVTLPTPTVPERSPEEIAADAARAELSRFRFLGYLTDKDSSIFLSRDVELFIAKSGDVVLRTYKVKTVGKDHVVLSDTATKVEVRLEMTGGADGKPR
jgi:hypothetical protein